MFRLQTSQSYRLKSNRSVALFVPKMKVTSHGKRAFFSAATRLWNKVPVEVRSQSVETLKQG